MRRGVQMLTGNIGKYTTDGVEFIDLVCYFKEIFAFLLLRYVGFKHYVLCVGWSNFRLVSDSFYRYYLCA